MDELKATIELATNGLILKTNQYYDYVDENCKDSMYIEKQVFEFNSREDEEHAQIKALIDLFWTIKEYFGIYNNKYSKHALEMFCECEREEIEKDRNSEV